VTWEKFQQLIRSIFVVKDEEILCSKFFDILPRFVDLQVAGKDVNMLFPEASHHLHQCPECNEVYQTLLRTVLSDKETEEK
jgi:hypothetical protein